MINQRVKEWFLFQKKAGKRQNYFAEIWDLSKQRVNQYAKGDGPIGIEPVIKILDFDKDLNARWLILGEGKMYEDELKNNVIKPEISYNKEIESIFSELRNQVKVKDEQLKFYQKIIEKKLNF